MKIFRLALSCLLSILCFYPTLAHEDSTIEDPTEDSVCDITSFVAEYTPNSCDGEIILIEFDFNAIDFGANGFTVEANGASQAFNIGDDYQIFMITLCVEEVELVIIDNDDPDCFASLILEPACCDCEFDEPTFGVSECSDDSFDLFVDFFPNTGTCVNYDWFINFDGQSYPLVWNSATQQLEAFGLVANSDEVVLTFELCNESPLEECYSYIIDNPCYSSCDITSFVAEYIPNSCEGEIILIEFDFNATDFGINGFTVETNGGPQAFNIGDDYQIFMISLCDEDIELVIIDNDDPNCFATVILDPACCDCEFDEPIFGVSECNDGTFDMFLNFFSDVGTCVNYDWFITWEGESYPLVWNSATQQLEAFGLDGNTVEQAITFELCNESPLEECYSYVLDNPCFSTCSITSFEANYQDNSCEGELIAIEFDFDATDFGVNGFTVNGQTYNLGDDYIFFMIALCNEDIEITITDNDDPSCSSTIVLGPACCECEIDEPMISSECSGDSFDIFIDFFDNFGTCVNYDWFISFEGNEYPLVWNSGTQQYEAFDLFWNTTDEEITIELCNDSPLEECFTYVIENPCFVDCSINSFTAEYDESSCIGEIIYVDFEFDAVDFGTSGFEISNNGDTQFFNLGDDYTFIVLSDCSEDVTLTLTDFDNPNCMATVTLGPACCDCEISEPVIEVSECDFEYFNLTIDDFLNSGSCLFYDWFVTIEGVDYDLIWNGMAYEAVEILATLPQLTVILCNEGPLQECYTYIIDNPCFIPIGDCGVNSFEATYLEDSCDGEIVFFEFEFDAVEFGVNGFEISAGGDTQFYNLDDEYLFAVLSDCSEDIIVTISDVSDPTCQFTINLGPACCDCIIEEPTFEVSDCDNGNFNLFIDFFDYEGTCVNYDWFISSSGTNYDLVWNSTTQQYEASNLVVTDSIWNFSLCNDSPLNECWDYELLNPCFEAMSEACVINSFTATYDTTSCDGEIIFIDFEFDADNFGSDGFMVSSSGFSQFYNLGDEYTFAIITLCVEDIILNIADANDAACQSSINLGPACCPCEIEEPNIQVSACTDDAFNIFIDYFELSGTCVGYDWFIEIDGNAYDLTWNSTNQNYEVLSVVASDSVFTLLLCNDSPLEECWSYLYANPCYEEGDSECLISSFTANYIDDACVGEITYISFDFEATDFGLDGFEVMAGGDTQFYNLGDEYIFAVISDCADDIIISIADANDANCQSSVILGPACCDCIIEEPGFTAECNDDGTLDLTIFFFNYEGSCVSYEWYVVIDSLEFNLIWDGANYLVFGIPSTDPVIEFELCSDGPLNECFSYEVDNPCFIDEAECMINSFSAIVDTLSCDADGNVNLVLDFDVISGGSTGYSVSVDGFDMGSFDYPPGIEISVSSNCDAPTFITIQDNELVDCTWTEEVNVCCPIISSVDNIERNFVNISYDLNGDVIISNLVDQALNLSLCSIDGKTISQTSVLDKEIQRITMTHFPRGIYILSIMNEAGNVVTYKVMNLNR